MKKITSRILAVLMTMVLAFGMLTVAVSADGTVSLRIEGPDKNYYYNTSIDLTSDEFTVGDLIAYADETDDTLTVVGLDKGYITTINGVKAGTYTAMKWDGWVYTVNGEFPSVGVNDYTLSAGDEVVLFYSDYYNSGMEIPIVDDSLLSTEGVIGFTYGQPVFDEDYNVTGYNYYPIVGADVEFNGKTYVTDENGQITVDNFMRLKNGSYSIQISKYLDGGCPSVLRLAPDFTVKVTGHSFLQRLIAFFKQIIESIKNLFKK